MKCFALRTITLEIGRDGRNPQCVESHALDIVEVVHNSLPRPTAVFAFTRVAGHSCVISSGKPVCEKLHYPVRCAPSPNTPAGYLIDGSRAPICGICGKDRSDQEKRSQNDSEWTGQHDGGSKWSKWSEVVVCYVSKTGSNVTGEVRRKNTLRASPDRP
jgi:p-aminobenzoyl-glutamate transporter AbgT